MGVRLNLGCGTTAPDGWVNLDRSPGITVSRVPLLKDALVKVGVLRGPQAQAEWPENVHRWDASKGLRYPDGSVEAIYTSHMLEHLPRGVAERLLRECARVLRSGGLLRIAVPDLRAYATAYLASTKDDAADEFMRTTLLGREASPSGFGRLTAAVTGASHLWMYDTSSLEALCRASGFKDTNVCEFREGRLPDLQAVEHREESIFVEAEC